MPILGIKVNVDGPRAAFKTLREDQLPWTIARALTKTAQDGQAAVRALESSVFKLRNDWIVRNTKITPATKTSLVAAVLEDAANRKGMARDYLSDQADGGERSGFVTWEGGRYRAIPTKYCSPFGRTIPRELLPQNLLGAVAGRYTTFNRKGQIALKNQKLVAGFVFFVVRLTGGELAICGRKPGQQEAIPFYILTSKANLRGIFPMYRTVQETVEERFAYNFSTAAAETMSNDLLRGSGLRIKL